MSTIRVDGPRLSLVPFAPSFLTQRYVDWLNDPILMRYSEQRHRRHTLASNAVYAAGFDGVSRLLWAIVDRQDGTHLGNINAYIDLKNQVADIGLLIGETSRQGQGLGSEAWIGAMHALFVAYRVRKLTGGCAATNFPMRRIMEHAKMLPDGVRAGQLLLDGKAVDVVHMAIFSDNFSQDTRFSIVPGSPD